MQNPAAPDRGERRAGSSLPRGDGGGLSRLLPRMVTRLGDAGCAPASSPKPGVMNRRRCGVSAESARSFPQGKAGSFLPSQPAGGHEFITARR